MNLVVLGEDIPTRSLKEIAKLVGAARIEQIDAAAFRMPGAAPAEGLAARCAADGIDFAFVPAGRRLTDFGLFVTDMDSTIIDIECIDELADMRGLKSEVAEITEAAMRGELDFSASLTRRVALLEGLEESALQRVMDERRGLNPGAERLMQGLKAAGLRTMLVSGGFTYFTERLQARLGFDEAYANELEIADGKLTGRIVGPVLDGAAKARHLLAARHALGLDDAQVMAAGDGANDIPMLNVAGFGVAYRAKPALRAVADCCLDHAPLDALLSLFADPV
jgi:phosphoserine phosphatase